MQEKKFSWTPIVVGVVIGALGVLGGLYIAGNAREHLAASQKPATDMFFDKGEQQQQSQAASATTVDAVEDYPTELPPLDPVILDLGTQQQQIADSGSVKKKKEKEVQETTSAATEEVGDDEVQARDEAGKVDDFVEVSLEELDSQH